MSSKISNTSTTSREFRICSPRLVIFSNCFKRIQQPILRILGNDHSYIADSPLSDKLSCFSGHNMSCISICYTEKAAVLFCDLFKFFALFYCKAKRLLTHNAYSLLKEKFSCRIMETVGCNDIYPINLIFSLTLFFSHDLKGLIVSVRINSEFLTGLHPFLFDIRKTSGYQFSFIIESQSSSVNTAYEGSGTATDHSVLKFSLSHFFHLDYYL